MYVNMDRVTAIYREPNGCSLDRGLDIDIYVSQSPEEVLDLLNTGRPESRCTCPPADEREGKQWVCTVHGVDQARCKCVHAPGDSYKCPVHGHMNELVRAVSEANGRKARYCRDCDSWWPVLDDEDEARECCRFCEAEKVVAP